MMMVLLGHTLLKFLWITLATGVCAAWCADITYTVEVNTRDAQVVRFDSGLDRDLGFTFRVIAHVREAVSLLDAGTAPLPSNRLLPNEVSEPDGSLYSFWFSGDWGFVVDEGTGSHTIYFDGRQVGPALDRIHFRNCCSYREILPTVFENGVLLFYAVHGGSNYLIEYCLSPEGCGETGTKGPTPNSPADDRP